MAKAYNFIMNGKGGLCLLCLLIIPLLFSCSQQMKPDQYFPLVDGSYYEYNNGQSRMEVNFFAHKGKYDLYTVANFVDDTMYIMQDEYIKTDDQIFWYGFQSADFGKIYFEPPINRIPRITSQDTTMVAVVKEHRDNNSVIESYTLRVELHYLGKEKVTVPAGTFDAVHYRYIMKYLGKKPEESLMDFSGDWWYGKNVGLIKQQEGEIALELTKYHLP